MREGRQPGAAAGPGGCARRVLVVGLTGGIAAGKSTVAGMLRERGAVVLDADQTAREVVRPGEPALAEIVQEFGGEMLLPEGGLDRGRMAGLVFSCETARLALNRITHPRIEAVLAERIRAVDEAASGPAVVVVEAAVLLEAGWEQGVDLLVGVAAKQTTQVARLIERYGLDPARALERLRSQTPSAELRDRVDHLVRTDVSLAETERQVAGLWIVLSAAARRKHERAAGGATAAPAGPVVPRQASGQTSGRRRRE